MAFGLGANSAANAGVRDLVPPTLRIHFPKVKLVLDPQRMEDAYSMAVNLQLYRGLLRYTAEGVALPDLAESWTESKDHLRYVFTLRKATFSNGKPITARDVQMSFARMFFIGASMGADLDYIKGVEPFRKTGNLADLGIRALSERKVEFTLVHPSALFLKQIAVVDCGILSLRSFRDELKETPDGAFSGPYRLKTTPNEIGVTLERWRSDTLDSPNPPKSITVLLTEESPLSLARRGATDSLDHDPVSEAEKASLIDQGWQASPTELVGEYFLILNPKKIPAAVRALLAARVDSAELLKAINLPKTYSPAYGVIPTGIPGSIPSRQFLYGSEAETVPKGLRVHFQLDYQEGNPIQEKVIWYLKKVWNLPRVSIEYRGLKRADALARMFGKKSEACIGQKGLDYPDGFSVLGYFKSGYVGNYFHVEDAELDQVLRLLLTEFNSEARAKAYQKIQQEILDHHTVIPLFFGSQASGLWSPRVKRVPSHPIGQYTIPFETIEMSQ